MEEYMAPARDGIRNTKITPRESITPFSLRDFFLELSIVVEIPARVPMRRAGKGLGNTLELEAYAMAPLIRSKVLRSMKR
jgi:hypothetical protein